MGLVPWALQLVEKIWQHPLVDDPFSPRDGLCWSVSSVSFVHKKE